MYALLPEAFYDINSSSGKRAIFLKTNLKSAENAEEDYAMLV